VPSSRCAHVSKLPMTSSNGGLQSFMLHIHTAAVGHTALLLANDSVPVERVGRRIRSECEQARVVALVHLADVAEVQRRGLESPQERVVLRCSTAQRQLSQIYCSHTQRVQWCGVGKLHYRDTRKPQHVTRSSATERLFAASHRCRQRARRRAWEQAASEW
jgi:hypothetical protein